MDPRTVPTELHELLGDPTEVETTAGATAWIWEIDSDGDGILLARVGGRDTQPLRTQVKALQRYADESQLRPRRIVASAGMSGNRRFHERPDLLAVERAITDKDNWCEFSGCTDLLRISRDREGVELFLDFLSENGVDLRLASAGFEPQRPLSLLTILSAQMAASNRPVLIPRPRRSTAAGETAPDWRRTASEAWRRGDLLEPQEAATSHPPAQELIDALGEPVRTVATTENAAWVWEREPATHGVLYLQLRPPATTGKAQRPLPFGGPSLALEQLKLLDNMLADRGLRAGTIVIVDSCASRYVRNPARQAIKQCLEALPAQQRFLSCLTVRSLAPVHVEQKALARLLEACEARLETLWSTATSETIHEVASSEPQPWRRYSCRTSGLHALNTQHLGRDIDAKLVEAWLCSPPRHSWGP